MMFSTPDNEPAICNTWRVLIWQGLHFRPFSCDNDEEWKPWHMNAVSIEEHSVNMSRLHCFHTCCEYTQALIHTYLPTNTLVGTHAIHTHSSETFISSVTMQVALYITIWSVILFMFLFGQGDLFFTGCHVNCYVIVKLYMQCVQFLIGPYLLLTVASIMVGFKSGDKD